MSRKLFGMTLAAGAFIAMVVVLWQPNEVDFTLKLGRWDTAFEKCFRTPKQDQIAGCIADLSQTAGKSGQIGAGLTILRKGTERSVGMFSKCHDYSHKLGREAIEQGSTLVNVYSVKFPDCRLGFYHGGLEAYAQQLTLPQLQIQMPNLCSAFGDEKSEATGECVHVLGHFVFDRTQPDLQQGIVVCQILPSVRLQGRCVDGLLMQAIEIIKPAVGNLKHDLYPLLVTLWGTGHDEQKQRILNLCGTLTKQTLTYTCYTNATQAAAVLWNHDYVAVAKLCDSVADVWQQPCFEGIAASGFAAFAYDPEKIAEACHASNNNATKYCMASLSFTFALQDSTGRVATICALALDHEQETCQYGIARGKTVRARINEEVNAIPDDYSQ